MRYYFLKTFLFALILLVSISIPKSLMADCKIGTTGDGNYFYISPGEGKYVAQIFTACSDGPMTAFYFDLFSHGYQALNTEVRIIKGTSFSKGGGQLLGTLDINPTSEELETIHFSPTNYYHLTKGETYTFWLEMYVNSGPRGQGQGRSGGLEFSINSAATEPYVGAASEGSFYDDLKSKGSEGRMVRALAFRANFLHLEPIPTLSQWGLIVFGLLILNMGVYFVRQVMVLG